MYITTVSDTIHHQHLIQLEFTIVTSHPENTEWVHCIWVYNLRQLTVPPVMTKLSNWWPLIFNENVKTWTNMGQVQWYCMMTIRDTIGKLVFEIMFALHKLFSYFPSHGDILSLLLKLQALCEGNPLIMQNLDVPHVLGHQQGTL